MGNEGQGIWNFLQPHQIDGQEPLNASCCALATPTYLHSDRFILSPFITLALERPPAQQMGQERRTLTCVVQGNGPAQNYWSNKHLHKNLAP